MISIDYTYYFDGLLKHQLGQKSNGTLVNEYTIEYNGNRMQDVLHLVDADGNPVNSTLTYTYDHRDRVTKYEKTGDRRESSGENNLHSFHVSPLY